MSEAQSDMPEMTNTQEKDSQSQGLPMILVDVVSKSIEEFRSMCRAKAKNLIVPPRTEAKKKGKRMKNPLVAEKKVSFCLPENCDTGSFKDIDKVTAKLGGWKLQSRVRDTKMRDTYYYHISSTKTFRSINEVVNYILPDTYSKFPTRKRSRKGQHEVETPEKSKKNTSPSENSETAEYKEENIELQNISQETLPVAPAVGASVEQEPKTHDEATIDIVEDCPHVEQVPQTHDEAIIKVEEDRPLVEQEPQNHDDSIVEVEEHRPPVEEEPQTHDVAITNVEEDRPRVEAINEPVNNIGSNEDRPQHEDIEDIPMFIGGNEDRPQHGNLGDIRMYNGVNENPPQHEDLEDISQDFGAYDRILDAYFSRC